MIERPSSSATHRWISSTASRTRNSCRFLTDDKQPLTTLDMRDSETAIKSVVNCVREHPFTPQPPPEAGDTSFYGTAFFVSRHTLLTNNHVVKECKGPVRVRYPDKPWSSARVFGADDTNDLALLDTEMESPAVAGFHLQPRLGESVAAYGFPYAGVLSSSGNFTLGNVTSLTGMERRHSVCSDIYPHPARKQWRSSVGHVG